MVTKAEKIGRSWQDFSVPVEARMKKLLESLAHDPDWEGWDTPALQACKFISWEPNKVVWEVTVTEKMLNRTGNLHGGCAATLGDLLSGTAWMTIARPGYMDAGHVSRTLTTTYFRPAPLGTVMRIYCESVSVGKTLAHCKADFKTLDGKMLVSVTHDKALIPHNQAKL